MNTKQAKQRFGIIGNNDKLDRAIDVSLQVAPTDISILVIGESGTGKHWADSCFSFTGEKERGKIGPSPIFHLRVKGNGENLS